MTKSTGFTVSSKKVTKQQDGINHTWWTGGRKNRNVTRKDIELIKQTSEKKKIKLHTKKPRTRGFTGKFLQMFKEN